MLPVTMPELPQSVSITSLQQFKAISDRTRSRILGIIQNQPATAKQIAGRLCASPGAIGHHLHVLEAAGLAKVVARRLVRGIVRKLLHTHGKDFLSMNFQKSIIGDDAAYQAASHHLSQSRRLKHMQVMSNRAWTGTKPTRNLFGCSWLVLNNPQDARARPITNCLELL